MDIKKLLKWICLALILAGGYELLGSVITWILSLAMTVREISVGEAATIGIIGGADGPTAIFVTRPAWTGYVLPVVCLLIGIVGFLKLRKTEK